MDLSAEQLNFLWAAAGDYGVKILIAIIVYFIGSTIAKFASNGTRRLLNMQEGIDPSVAHFGAGAVRWIGLILVLVVILSVFGISTSSIAAVLGAATLAIGLALRDTLANVASGIMILVLRPFLTGHVVAIGDTTGTVRSINLFNTEIASFDNIQILVPNKDVFQSSITNYSVYERRRMDTVIGVDYGTDIAEATRLIRSLVEADARTIMDPEPFIRVTALADSSVNIELRVWCLAGDVFDLKFDLTRAIKERFDEAGISIPYPHRELVLKHVPAELTNRVTAS